MSQIHKEKPYQINDNSMQSISKANSMKYKSRSEEK